MVQESVKEHKPGGHSSPTYQAVAIQRSGQVVCGHVTPTPPARLLGKRLHCTHGGPGGNEGGNVGNPLAPTDSRAGHKGGGGRPAHTAVAHSETQLVVWDLD